MGKAEQTAEHVRELPTVFEAKERMTMALMEGGFPHLRPYVDRCRLCGGLAMLVKTPNRDEDAVTCDNVAVTRAARLVWPQYERIIGRVYTRKHKRCGCASLFRPADCSREPVGVGSAPNSPGGAE